ncbi:MAG: MotA/TolQ/ExbB proton channel family protein [Kiritimatiellae bacterium]|nr:MotA/TolQ/ExbB proton channel family protein [Kiritimatiellia bacterium]
MLWWSEWLVRPVTADIRQAFIDSNWLSGKLIVLVLIVASIGAWSVMYSKWRDLRRARRASEDFLAAFRQESNPLAIFLQNRSAAFRDSPVFQVYQAGCVAIGVEIGESEMRTLGAVASGGATRRQAMLSPLQIEVVRRVTERTVADQALQLESGMGWLMIAVSASPMLGLLGTVWGVLDAFGAMAHRGAANLSAVAPGISGALLTTVVGLLVALPSSVGYNVLAGHIRTLAVQMDNFSQEFVAEVQRAFSRE